ncbi:hypothetical protein [Thermophagus xiamenensis]|uniref:Uncharacterized protein n=1 Tax=Thermophagus xiamenensis TaxID=385682 RepID=A0A1I2FNX2_9BACT|nr:hypothetical protein [Thermophagus xiamenensis]SFF06290.1 hypothetical protein SAMN05444380_1322 [Thermophagus xiamenensis]
MAKYGNSSSKKINRDEALKRKHKATFLMNDKELEAFEVYCKRYKIKNKARFMRESVMRAVMDRFMEDYPTLFQKEDLDRLKVIEQNNNNQ